MTHYHYISLYLLFFAYLYLVSEIESFTPLGRLSHSSVVAENKLYLFGGEAVDAITQDYISTSIIYSFNLDSLTWGIPTIQGNSPVRLREIRSVIDNTGKMYIFGGMTSKSSSTIQYFNDMIIFNII